MWETIIAAALAAAGAGLQVAGSVKSKNEMERKVRAELLRQKGYQAQAQSAYQQNADQNTAPKAEGEISTGAGERQAAYEKAQAIPLTAGQAPVVSTPVSMAQLATLGSSNQARAGLAGYDQWGLNRALQNMRTQQSLGTINNFSLGSNNLLPMELQQASHKGDGLNQIGQLVGLAGMLVGGAGALSGAGSANAAGTAGAQGAAATAPTMGYGWGSYMPKALQMIPK